MAAVKAVPAKPAAPSKPAPPKPGAPKPPAKPAAAAPPKPAVPAKPGAPKPPPLKPAAAATPPKPGPAKPAAPSKPGAPAKPPTAAAAAPKGEFVTKKEFEAMVDTCESLHARLTVIELSLAGYGPNVDMAADGTISLNYEKATEDDLRDWAWQFGVGDPNDEPATIKAALQKAEKAKGFEGWVIVNELPRPGAEETEEAPAEEVSYTPEQINAMNPAELKELATSLELDLSDKPTPKVLRTRIIEALTPPEETGEEAAEGETEVADGDAPELEVGTQLLLTHPTEGTQAWGTFTGLDDDGDFVFDCEDFGGSVALGSEFVDFASADA